MAATERDGGFAGGDPFSRILIDLAADRHVNFEVPVQPHLVELAQRHGLVGLLADQTDDRLVRAVFSREAARREILARHLERILVLFDRAGIQASVLKGPGMALRYRKPSHRTFSDIDLLVPRVSLEQALNVISKDEAVLSVPSKGPKSDKRDIVLQDERGVRFNVDLHWDLFSYRQLRGAAMGATDAAWARAQFKADSAHGPLWEIDDAFRIAFLCTHATLDHRFRLILFRDLLEIAWSGVDWWELHDVVHRWDLRSTTYLALWVAHALVDAPVPQDFLSSLRPASLPLSYLEYKLPKVDIVRFDGRRVHPANLATVLLHDSVLQQVALLIRAPIAFPGWRRRILSRPDWRA